MPRSTKAEGLSVRGCCAVGLMVAMAGSWGLEAQEIWQIQGSGTRSPYENQSVTTTNNTVTGIGNGFFFIQTPDNRSDGDVWTSDGVLVRHSGSPVVGVGDRVKVSGGVVERYGQTEISQGVSVTVTSSGRPLPKVVVLDSEMPTPNQPWPETELERFEGMRVAVDNGMVSGPTDSYGDAWSTASGQRLFREPGIEYPGLPDLPVWDGNPEAFEIDPDALGLAHVDLAAGSTFTARGVLAYAFGSYQLWPTALEVFGARPRPSPPGTTGANRLTVASQNCYRLARTGGDVGYQDRLVKLSAQVRLGLGSPSIVAVQEVDTRSVLQDLADRIEFDDPAVRYSAHLVEGNDPSGIDVGFLVRRGVDVSQVRQIGADIRFTWDQSLLFDRPPLVLETEISDLVFSVVVVHLKSLGGVEDPGASGDRVRRKRFEQSEWLSEWVQNHQESRPEDGLLIVGDFNAFEFSDGYVDVLGQITGLPDPAGALIPADTGVDPPLFNTVFEVARGERYSYIYRGSAEVLDHGLADQTLVPFVRDVIYSRGNADAPIVQAQDPDSALRSSDHDGLVITLGSPVRGGGRRVTP